MNRIFLGSLGFSIAEQRELSSVVADENLRVYLEAEQNGLSLISVHPGSLKELLQKSIDDCLSKTPLLPEQIQAIYLSSNTLDFQNLADCEWITSVIEQAGMQAAPVFYIGMAGCAGFHWLLQASANRIKLGQIQNALLMTFDKAEGSLQRIYKDDPNFIYVTGDAAAACIVSSDKVGMNYELIGDIEVASDLACLKPGHSETELINISSLLKKVYSKSDLSGKTIDIMVSNNYTKKISLLFSQLAKTDFSKVYVENISRFGHCFSSDNLLNLDFILNDGIAKAGDKILTLSTGPYQSGACVFEVCS